MLTLNCVRDGGTSVGEITASRSVKEGPSLQATESGGGSTVTLEFPAQLVKR